MDWLALKEDLIYSPYLKIALVVVAGVILLLVASLFLVQGSSLVVTVENSAGQPLAGVEIAYKQGSQKGNVTTNALGEAEISVSAGIPLELRVKELTIDGVEFKSFSKTVTVSSGANVEVITLGRKASLLIERTVIMQYASGIRVYDQEVAVKFSCQTGVSPEPDEMTGRTGKFIHMEPLNCGRMHATVTSPGEFEGLSSPLEKAVTIIVFESREVEKADLRVRIKESGEKVVNWVDFEVTLRGLDGLAVETKHSGNYGEARFSGIVPGTYSVSVSDVGNDYAIATESGIEVEENQDLTIDVLVSKASKGTLTVDVVDASGGSLGNVIVRLVNSLGEIIEEKETGSEGQSVGFVLMEEDNYTLYAIHSDYLYGELALDGILDGAFSVELEALTEENSGRIVVTVLDEENLTVENALVKLRFLENGFLAPYEPQVTDSNGVASFVGVKAGSYYASVEKFPAAGDNKEQGQEIDVRKTTEFLVNLFVGETIVSITAVDADEEPIYGAKADIYSLSGQKMGEIALTEGVGLHEMKADRMVYLVVSKEGYQTVQTMPEQLYPQKGLDFVVVLLPRKVQGMPEVMFAGIYNKQGFEVQQLDAGHRYIVKFRLSVPETEDYESGGFHFRVGSGNSLLEEPLTVREVIAGDVDWLLRGITFDPGNAALDLQNLADGEAKWVSFEWQDLKKMDYLFGVEIRVKSQTVPGEKLPMYYRTWLETDSGDFVRMPLSAEQNLPEEQALYANTYSLEFYEGENSGCESELCYTGEWIYGEAEKLYLSKPYETRVNSSYTFNFSILNKSEKNYPNAALFVRSVRKGLEIDSYKFVDPSAREISVASLNSYEISGVGLGNLGSGKSILASLNFTPKELALDSFEVELVSDQKTVLKETVSVEAKSDWAMNITVEPNYIGSYSPTPLTVTVKEFLRTDAEIEGLGVEIEMPGAIVRLTRISPDKSETRWEETTDSSGKAEFLFPGSRPGTIIEITAEKPNYSSSKVVLLVDSQVLEFSPGEFDLELDAKSAVEKLQRVTIKNKIGAVLEIQEIELSGNFMGLLDEEAMRNYLKGFKGEEIEGFSEKLLELFKVKLSNSARENLGQAETIEGALLVTVRNPAVLGQYDFVIPFTVKILVGGMPDNSPCLAISKNKWSAVTQGNRAIMEFEVYNSCMKQGRFVGLENLQGRLQWHSDAIGVLELTLINAETGESNTEILRPNVWSKFLENIRPDSTYYAMVSFTPKPEHVGEIAEFSVQLDGEIATDAGLQKVGSFPSLIEADIQIMNLDSCIEYPGLEDKLVISASNSQREFTINSSKCGNVPIEIYLCYNDSGCSGGTDEGYIILSNDRFVLSPDSPEKKVKVNRGNMPGIYGITVHASMPGTSFRKVDEVLVEIAPRPDEYFAIDKYSFSLAGQNATDSATLANSMFEEEVAVTASVCIWQISIDDPEWYEKPAADYMELGEIPGDPGATYILNSDFGEKLLKTVYDPCDEDYTGNVPDFVINLMGSNREIHGETVPSDLIGLYLQRFGDSIVVEDTDLMATIEAGVERRGMILTNSSGLEDADPLYDVLVIEATEHIHGDPYHRNPAITTEQQFAPYWVPDTGQTQYSQSFHIRLKTKDLPRTFIPTNAETRPCVQGTVTGRTGKGALPRTKLNWSWGNSGIALNACDYGNPDYIYCDATQFSIELSKKIHTLDEFLEQNSSAFQCPEKAVANEIENTIYEFNLDNSSNDVFPEKFGLESISQTWLSSDQTRISVSAYNDTAESQSITINIQTRAAAGGKYEEECFKELVLEPKERATENCSFTNLPRVDDYFISLASITEGNLAKLDPTNLGIAFTNIASASQADCWLPSMVGHYENFFSLEAFVNASQNISWTEEVSSVQDLEDLTKFKAYLIKDGYSNDFTKDFADYYLLKTLFDAPYWFADDASGNLASYFAIGSGRLNFSRKFVDDQMLPGPGLYNAELKIVYNEENPWVLFDSDGEPNAEITVILHKKDDAYPDSVFYYTPFNSNVGIESGNGRQGYGVNYYNNDAEVVVTSSGDFVTSSEIPGSEPVATIATKTEHDFRKINSSYSNRGLLMKVTEGESLNLKNLFFYPNYATPVVMKVEHGKDAEPFQVFYLLHEVGVPQEVGENLTFWTGAGSCFDFSGVPLFEAFNYTPDRRANQTDPVPNPEFLYGLDWSKSDYSGKVYLKTVFYTPIGNQFSLKASYPDNLSFLTPDSALSSSASLGGIAGMPYNSKDEQTQVSELSEVFSLVESGQVCMTNSGVETAFWWNPKVLYETPGNNASVKDFEAGLVAGQNCIG